MLIPSLRTTRAALLTLAGLALAAPTAHAQLYGLTGYPFAPRGGISQPTATTRAGALTTTPPISQPGPVINNVVASGQPYGGYGYNPYGYSMFQNPYSGYLNGAANVTLANAQYQQTIQQARVTREQARQASIDTRRAMLEERRYELATTPTLEDRRQWEIYQNLLRSRNDPPLTEIWSGMALNSLLNNIQKVQSGGVQGPVVPLDPDLLSHINLTTGATAGNIGLLKDGGKLTWPAILRRAPYKEQRTQIDKLMRSATEQARTGMVNDDVLSNLDTSIKALEKTLDDAAPDITPGDYTRGARYVRELKDAYRMLESPDVAKYFSPKYTPRGNTIGELVQQLTTQGLRFAPATSGDEASYTALQRALVTYDIGLSQLVTRSPEGFSSPGRTPR